MEGKKDYSLKEIFKTVFKNKKYIIRVTGIAAVLGIIVSLLLPVYYKSKTVFYAASPDLGLPSQVGISEKDRYTYGTEYDIDRLLSIAESDEVYSYLIDNFKLYQHYDIDPSKVKAPYYIREELKDMMKVLKTKLDAIEITVEDKDPIFAANMANAAREKISDIAQNLLKSSQKQSIDAYKTNIESQVQLIASVSDSIKAYRTRYNIVDAESQGEAYSEILSELASKEKTASSLYKYYTTNNISRDSTRKYARLAETSKLEAESLKEELVRFNQGATTVQQLVTEYERLINQIAIDRQRLVLLEAAYQSPFTSVHLVEKASPPVIKSRPKWSLIVLSITLLAFLFSTAFVLLKDTFDSWDWKEIVNGQ